jgi:hypothetical protein
MVFDYRLLRFLVGLIALTLPFIASALSGWGIPSISDSYCYNGRNAFVGMLFIVGAFMAAYNGHKPTDNSPIIAKILTERRASFIAAVAAIATALFPINCDFSPISYKTIIHWTAAGTLFVMLIYFCLVAFYGRAKIKGNAKARMIIYLVCGWSMIGCMAVLIIAMLFIPPTVLAESRIIYWAEFIALASFGIAWITAGHFLPILSHKDERLSLFKQSI